MNIDTHPITRTAGMDRHHLAVTAHVGYPSTHQQLDDFGLRHHEPIIDDHFTNGSADHLGRRLPEHLDFEDLGHAPSCDSVEASVHTTIRATLVVWAALSR